MDERKNDSSTTEQPKTGRRVPVEEFNAELPDHPFGRPLTDEEMQIKARREEMERRRADGLEHWKKYAEPLLEEANRLLCDHVAQEDEIAKLRALEPLPHHGDEPLPKDGEEDAHRCSRKCWAWLLQPLRYWPSDLLRIYGPVILFHPLIIDAVRRLSKFASDPLLIHNPDPVKITAENVLREKLESVPSSRREARRNKLLSKAEREAKRKGLRSTRPLLELGLSAIRSLEPPFRALALRDETEDRQRCREARTELRRISAALAGQAPVRPRSHRPIRVLADFEERREKGVPEKKAVADMARGVGADSGRDPLGYSSGASEAGQAETAFSRSQSPPRPVRKRISNSSRGFR